MRAAAYGIEPGPPRHTCDGCGLVVLAETRYGLPKAYLRRGGSPPGWKAVPRTEFTNWHYCKSCKLDAPGHEIAPEVGK